MTATEFLVFIIYLILFLGAGFLLIHLWEKVKETWLSFVRASFFSEQKYNLFEISIPKGQSKSPLAMEVFLNCLHQPFGEGTFKDVWIKGAERDNIPGIVEYTKDSPEVLISKLEERGFKEVAICGGSTIYTMFMQSGLVKKVYVTIEPRLFGEGMSIFNQSLDVQMKLCSTKAVHDESAVLLEYDVTS